MLWLTALIQIIPLVIYLMKIAEEAFDKQPDSGAEKKQFVMDALKAALTAIAGLSTGGQKATWEMLSGPIGLVIDAVCGLLFPHDE